MAARILGVVIHIEQVSATSANVTGLERTSVAPLQRVDRMTYAQAFEKDASVN